MWTRAGYGAIFRAQIVSGNITRYRHTSHLALHTQHNAYSWEAAARLDITPFRNLQWRFVAIHGFVVRGRTSDANRRERCRTAIGTRKFPEEAVVNQRR